MADFTAFSTGWEGVVCTHSEPVKKKSAVTEQMAAEASVEGARGSRNQLYPMAQITFAINSTHRSCGAENVNYHAPGTECQGLGKDCDRQHQMPEPNLK